jgi:hypothetical protein
MPKPWTGDGFVQMIMKLLRFASFPHKTAVAEAITMIHAQEVSDCNRQKTNAHLIIKIKNKWRLYTQIVTANKRPSNYKNNK